MGYDTDLLKETKLKCGCIEQEYCESHDFFDSSTYYTKTIKCFKCETNYAFIDEDENSDEEDESTAVESTIKDQVEPLPIVTPCYEVFLYVPFEYKSDAKELNANFDYDKKKWFIYSNSKHYKALVEIFNCDNFTTSYYGTKMKTSILEKLTEYKTQYKNEITQMYETIKERKESYERHLKQKNQIFNCECGGKYKSTTKSSHYKTNKHNNYMNTI